ncbi:MAG: prepilin-type N-terminal cleavage/methylation domain-containing protein [Magnetococcales bacterium]|nr:prepilin-type N-terminal cleavage/methylation domain-containing protein [Magnetococcales bacterium]MBF0157815.1 prepilin-type N-terminal cleavage/methylation domain-containing protein [Magnetococcales bacterium]
MRIPLFRSILVGLASSRYRSASSRVAVAFRARAGEAGVSLIELIMVLVILGIVAVSLPSQLSILFRDITLPRKITQAAYLAEEKAETVIYQVDQGTAAATACATDAASDTPVTGFTGFTRTASLAGTTCIVSVFEASSGNQFARYEFMP